MAQPPSVFFARLVCFVIGVVVILFSLVRRPAFAIKYAIPIAFLLPILMLFTLAIYEPAAAMHTVKQSEEVDRVVAMITLVDLEPNVPWINNRNLRSRPVVRNDFTLIDELENEASFAQAGFFLTVFFAVILAIVAIARRSDLAYAKGPRLWMLAGTLAACAIIFGVPLAMGHLYWHYGHQAESEGDYSKAVTMFGKAIGWDKRLDYDYAFHYDLGRMYGRAGMTGEPDYWAAIADTYEATGGKDDVQVDTGYNIYRSHIENPNCNPAMAPRMANTYLREANVRFDTGNDLQAIELLRQGLAIDPTNIEVRWAYATALTTQGIFGEAERQWNEIIGENEAAGLLRSKFFVSLTYRKTLTARAWSGLAWCYFATGNTHSAEACKANSTQVGSSYLPVAED
jgi:tetratricopeptide (TPR) repeat protein